MATHPRSCQAGCSVRTGRSVVMSIILLLIAINPNNRIMTCTRGGKKMNTCHFFAILNELHNHNHDDIFTLNMLLRHLPHYSTTLLLLGRYDAVFHLVTAAQGAERFYTLDNNQARSESPVEARDVDERLVASWNGHPRHYIIDNNGTITMVL